MQEESRIYRIPVNFTQGVTVLGSVFPARNLAETVICAVLLTSLELPLLRNKGVTAVLAALICTAILCAAVVLPGVDGGSFFSFLRLFLRFRFRSMERKEKPPRKAVRSKEKKEKRPAGKLRPAAAEPRTEDIWEDLVIPMRNDEEQETR